MSPNVDAGSTEHTAHDVARTARLDERPLLTSLACAPGVSKGQSSRPLLSFGLERKAFTFVRLASLYPGYRVVYPPIPLAWDALVHGGSLTWLGQS
jgi:hypothetical protein